MTLISVACPSSARAAEAEAGKWLGEKITAFLAQPKFNRSAWGIKVISLENGQTLFDHQAGKLLKPASNAKLFTSAAVLDRFGPDYRIRTSFYSQALPKRSGILKGDLIIYGRGDPSFAARFHEFDSGKSFDRIIAQLKRAGIKRIRGNLVGDETFFMGAPFGSGWSWDDQQYYYGAEVSALTSEDNVMDIVFRPGLSPGQPCSFTLTPRNSYLLFENRSRTAAKDKKSSIDLFRLPAEKKVFITGEIPLGGAPVTNAVTVPKPAAFFLHLLKQELVRGGIKVEGGEKVITQWSPDVERPQYEGLHLLAEVESPPMKELVTQMMKPSQNLYAQLLLLHLGAAGKDPETDLARRVTAEEKGLAELKRFLNRVGIPSQEVLLEEGSGLSRGALVTPNAILKLLEVMDRHPHAQAFQDSLPIAGYDGTLLRRFKNSPLEGNLRAKTGTLRYVNALSGYVTNRCGQRLGLSIMSNNLLPPSGQSARADVDALASIIAEHSCRLGVR